MKQAEVTFIQVAGIKTAELVLPCPDNSAGSNALTNPILMLHGWGVDLGLMQPLGEPLARLGYTVYLLDLPGFGQSAPPPAAWGVPDYANFVIGYLDAHRLERVFLVGHSFGGRIGLVLGAEHGERFVKLALADAAGVPAKPAPTANLRLKTYKAIRRGLYTLGAKGLADDLRERYNRRYGSADYQATSGVLRETFVRVVSQDLRPYAARVQPPTLLFWGDRDEDTPLWQGRELEKLIPDAGLVVYEGAGHYSYLERLSETVRTIDYFFKQEAQ